MYPSGRRVCVACLRFTGQLPLRRIFCVEFAPSDSDEGKRVVSLVGAQVLPFRWRAGTRDRFVSAGDCILRFFLPSVPVQGLLCGDVTYITTTFAISTHPVMTPPVPPWHVSISEPLRLICLPLMSRTLVPSVRESTRSRPTSISRFYSSSCMGGATKVINYGGRNQFLHYRVKSKLSTFQGILLSSMPIFANIVLLVRALSPIPRLSRTSISRGIWGGQRKRMWTWGIVSWGGRARDVPNSLFDSLSQPLWFDISRWRRWGVLRGFLAR